MAIGVAIAFLFVAVQPAMASVEVGNKCAANASTSEVTPISIANAPGEPLPAIIPSAGVITRWSFNFGLPIPPGPTLFETLKVFRPTGAPKQFQVVGESSVASILVSGTSTFSARLPVQAGDHFGALAAIGGSAGGIFCETKVAGDQLGFIAGTSPAGSTGMVVEESPGFQNPIVVVVEPDVDNDGFGDETQDQCPQSAAIQTACPIAKLSLSKIVKKSSVKILVSTDNSAPVSVTGTVKVNSKKLKLKGGKKTLKVGKIVTFNLSFPAKLKSALEELPAARSLTLKVVATAKNIAGTTSTKKLTVKLKGQG